MSKIFPAWVENVHPRNLTFSPLKTWKMMVGRWKILFGSKPIFRGRTVKFQVCSNVLEWSTLDLKKKNDAYFLPICRWHHYIHHFFGNMLYFVFFPKNHNKQIYKFTKNTMWGGTTYPTWGVKRSPLHINHLITQRQRAVRWVDKAPGLPCHGNVPSCGSCNMCPMWCNLGYVWKTGIMEMTPIFVVGIFHNY